MIGSRFGAHVRRASRGFALVALLSLVAALEGCASGARTEAMMPPSPVGGFDAASPLRNAIAIAEVSGGEATNPMWMSKVGNPELEEAIRATLLREGLLGAEPAKAPYRLKVILISLDQPWIGFTLTVDTAIRYILAREPAGEVVMDETLKVSGSAGVGDAFIAVERLRLANENAIRASIGAFLEKLRALPPPRPAGAPTS
jgi:hypothetical protein